MALPLYKTNQKANAKLAAAFWFSRFFVTKLVCRYFIFIRTALICRYHRLLDRPEKKLGQN